MLPQEVQFKALKIETFPTGELRTLTPELPPRVGTTERVLPFNGVDLDGWDYTEKFWSVKVKRFHNVSTFGRKTYQRMPCVPTRFEVPSV
jgi:hypothetical protein